MLPSLDLRPLFASIAKAPKERPAPRFDAQGEVTLIEQGLPRFHSPYAGPNSLRSRAQADLSATVSGFLGARIAPNVEAYLDPELAWGGGIGKGFGVAGYPNGDVVRQFTERAAPYSARAFVRVRVPVGHGDGQELQSEAIGRAPNILVGTVPRRRLVVQVGKIGPTDVFDTNSYANDPRAQFLNNAFVNSLAFDYPSDVRGYDWGATAAYVTPTGALRVGTFALPTTAVGRDVEYDGAHHGEGAELEIDPRLLGHPKPSATVRLLVYRNVAPMGDYRDALAAGDTPDVTAVRRVSGKAGVGLNAEQAIGDGGATGLFLRIGASEGARETYGYAEADRALSFGAQVSGARWRRKDDAVGLALGNSGFSGAHRAYLDAGGSGLALGDGRLDYGAESVAEAYYAHALRKGQTLTLDFQRIANPGDNHARGPVNVLSARLRVVF